MINEGIKSEISEPSTTFTSNGLRPPIPDAILAKQIVRLQALFLRLESRRWHPILGGKTFCKVCRAAKPNTKGYFRDGHQ